MKSAETAVVLAAVPDVVDFADYDTALLYVVDCSVRPLSGT